MSAKRNVKTASNASCDRRVHLVAAIFSSTALLALIAAMTSPQHGLVILLSGAFVAMSAVTLVLAGRLGTEFAAIRIQERENVLTFLETQTSNARRPRGWE